MLGEVPRWRKINYQDSTSGQEPFHGEPVLVGRIPRIRQGTWVVDDTNPDGAWSFTYSGDTVSSAVYWLPVPVPGDPHWLSPSKAIAQNDELVSEPVEVVIQVKLSNGAIRWVEGQYDRFTNNWRTSNRLILPHNFIIGAALIQGIPVISNESSVHGPTEYLWG